MLAEKTRRASCSSSSAVCKSYQGKWDSNLSLNRNLDSHNDSPIQVKLVELPAWFARRQKSPAAIMGVCSRAFWRWQHRYMQPRKVGMAGFYQSLFASMAFFYIINYARITSHRNYKYH